MAKKPLKTISTRVKIFRDDDFWVNAYCFQNLNGSDASAEWCQDFVHRKFGKTICPVSKTATVKVTLEVEEIE